MVVNFLLENLILHNLLLQSRVPILVFFYKYIQYASKFGKIQLIRVVKQKFHSQICRKFKKIIKKTQPKAIFTVSNVNSRKEAYSVLKVWTSVQVNLFSPLEKNSVHSRSNGYECHFGTLGQFEISKVRLYRGQK